jgi:hypothetical protein
MPEPTVEEFREFATDFIEGRIQLTQWQRDLVSQIADGHQPHLAITFARRVGRRAVTDAVMASWLANGVIESPVFEDTRSDEEREQFRATMRQMDAMIFGWLQGGVERVPDEITDADRARWASELDTIPAESDPADGGAGMTIDELIPGIAEALAEWREVRDE